MSVYKNLDTGKDTTLNPWVVMVIDGLCGKLTTLAGLVASARVKRDNLDRGATSPLVTLHVATALDDIDARFDNLNKDLATLASEYQETMVLRPNAVIAAFRELGGLESLVGGLGMLLRDRRINKYTKAHGVVDKLRRDSILGDMSTKAEQLVLSAQNLYEEDPGFGADVLDSSNNILSEIHDVLGREVSGFSDIDRVLGLSNDLHYAISRLSCLEDSLGVDVLDECPEVNKVKSSASDTSSDKVCELPASITDLITRCETVVCGAMDVGSSSEGAARLVERCLETLDSLVMMGDMYAAGVDPDSGQIAQKMLVVRQLECELKGYEKCVSSASETAVPVSEEVISDPVNHPKHYGSHPSGVECIDIVEHYNFNIGNVIKYLWRCGLKDSAPGLQDLKKAEFYLKREIANTEKSPESAE